MQLILGGRWRQRCACLIFCRNGLLTNGLEALAKAAEIGTTFAEASLEAVGSSSRGPP
jgi:hypothetical protein